MSQTWKLTKLEYEATTYVGMLILLISALHRCNVRSDSFLSHNASETYLLSFQYGFIVCDRRYISLKSSRPFLPRITCCVMKSKSPLSHAPPRTNCSRYRSPQASQGAIAFSAGGFVAAMNHWTIPVQRSAEPGTTLAATKVYRDVSFLLVR